MVNSQPMNVAALSAASAASSSSAQTTPTRAATYGRQPLSAGRVDVTSPAPPRSRNSSHVRRSPFSADSTNGLSARARHFSNHNNTRDHTMEITMSTSGGGDPDPSSAAPAFVPLSRHQSQPARPTPTKFPNTPGTPGTRSRLFIGNNAVMRPLAMTPMTHASSFTTSGMSSTSMISPTRGSSSAVTTSSLSSSSLPSEDALRRIFANCLPTLFEALAKYQFHQATTVLDSFIGSSNDHQDGATVGATGEDDVRREWKNWDAFAAMVRLAASCESSYNLMRYLEPEMLHSVALDQLYEKLVVLLNHLVEDIEPVVRRAQLRTNGAPSTTGTSTPVSSIASASALLTELERLTTGDLEYYYGLLDQASEFFALRVPMIELYRGLATQNPPHEYSGMAQTLERLMQRYSQFDHPLLATLKDSTLEELRTVRSAFQSEICISQYEFTKSMAALHRFKSSLRKWSDHIDSVSEYPLFDESDDDDEYALSSSAYSNATSGGSSTTVLYTQHQPPPPSRACPSHHASDGQPPPTTTDTCETTLARPQRASSFRRKSFTQSLASASELLAFSTASDLAIATSQASAVTPTGPPPPESQNTFTRILSQRALLLKKGLSLSNSLRSKSLLGHQATSSASSGVTPTNTLEHAILGSTPSVIGGGSSSHLASSLLTPSGNGLNSVGAGGGGLGGFNTTNPQTLAAEMMASAVSKQEREDGYALPVYQWSKRFYRSLVAKFTLYFHKWLEPFEAKSDALSPYDLTRFIRSPVGISYLQLIDVLLAKGSNRIEDGSASIMLILETDKLTNKGATFHANGYLCPGYSHPQPQSSSNKTETSTAIKPAANNRSSLLPRTTASSLSSSSSSSAALSIVTSTSSSSASSASSSSNQSGHNLFNLNLEPEAEDNESGDFAPLWGLRGWPAVFCYPQSEAPLQHWPNIVSLIMDNRHVLETQSSKSGGGATQAAASPFVHTERRLKVSYYISSIDPAVYLVLLLEGKRRPSEKTAHDFMQTMAENLQHRGVYQRGGGSTVSSSSSASY